MKGKIIEEEKSQKTSRGTLSRCEALSADATQCNLLDMQAPPQPESVYLNGSFKVLPFREASQTPDPRNLDTRHSHPDPTNEQLAHSTKMTEHDIFPPITHIEKQNFMLIESGDQQLENSLEERKEKVTKNGR